jgi:CheY-like chemotaxis protein
MYGNGAPQPIQIMKIKDSTSSHGRQRILVVEDEPNIRRLNVDMLIWSGYEVDSAADGAVAWELLQQNHYDLLITDNEMLNVSGVELLGKLHAAHMTLPCGHGHGNFAGFHVASVDPSQRRRVQALHVLGTTDGGERDVAIKVKED